MTAVKMRHAQGNDTREVILTVAERLFAEYGVVSVSNRQVSEAAGQGNNFAVGYHFGTKNDLVLAIIRKHAPSIQRHQMEMLQRIEGSGHLRDWLACLVQPVTDHLESLGNPTWYGRFVAQLMTDPALRQMVIDEAINSAPMQGITTGLARIMPSLPAEVLAERGDMSRLVIVHMCAERERALHAGTPTPRTSWNAAATGLVDALMGLWLAPVTDYE